METCTACRWLPGSPKNARAVGGPRRKTSPEEGRVHRGRERFSGPSKAAGTEPAQHRDEAADHESKKNKTAHVRTTGRRGKQAQQPLINPTPEPHLNALAKSGNMNQRGV